MVNENDVEALDELEDEEVEDSIEDDSTEEDSQQPDELALLKAEVAALRNQNSKIAKDFSAAVGRYQSLVDRLESGRGDTDKLSREIASSVNAVDKVLETILSADDISPELRARALEVRRSAKAEADLDSLRAEVESLKNRKPEPVVVDTSNELSPLERTVHTMINKAGFSIEDFNWTEANAVFSRDGDEGVVAYFTDQIVNRKVEASSTGRRQAKKESSKGSPRGADVGGDITSQLGDAADGDLDKGIALLRSMGVNV